jgi:hypothetical protein
MTGTDSAAGGSADGAGSTSPSDGGADATVDAQPAPHDSGTGDAAPGAGPAGKAGVDAYSAALCGHEQTCALIDGGAATLASCVASFQSFYEAPGANPWGGNPPLELYRADYVSALGACIARASCSEALATSEARCSATLVAGTDAGAATIAPTAALAAFCHAFQTSPCLAADSGAQDCTAAMMLYDDQALSTATACFSSSSSCPTVNSCFAAAFTQP